MIADIAARLAQQRSTLGLKLIGGAAEFQVASKSNPAAVPAVFVFRSGERAPASTLMGRTRQRVATEVSVVLVTRNVSDAAGAAASADIEVLRPAVRGCLLGWAPPGGDPLNFSSGHLLAFRDSYLWWLDVYSTGLPISSA